MELWLKTRLESTNSDTIMDEINKWRYDSGSYQTTRNILYIPHLVTQTIPNISGESSTGYKKTPQDH